MTAVTRTRLHEGDPPYPRDEDPATSLFDPDDVAGADELEEDPDEVNFEDDYPRRDDEPDE